VLAAVEDAQDDDVLALPPVEDEVGVERVEMEGRVVFGALRSEVGEPGQKVEGTFQGIGVAFRLALAIRRDAVAKDQDDVLACLLGEATGHRAPDPTWRRRGLPPGFRPWCVC
jgi:hypothetical protein